MSSKRRKQAARAARAPERTRAAPDESASSAAPSASSAAPSEGTAVPSADADAHAHERRARWLFWTLVVIALGIHVYVFVLTREQPVWWDEAEYLIKGRHIALDTPESGWFVGRPILLPVVIAGVYGVGLGETTVRLLVALSSLAGVLLTFRVARRIAGEAIGDVVGFGAGLLLSCHYIVLFYAGRIMTELPQMTLTLLAIELLLSHRPRWMLGSGAALALATLMRFTSALLGPVFVIWALLAARRHLRTLVVAAVLGIVVMVPYLWWSQATYGDPVKAWNAQQYLMQPLAFGERLAGIWKYTTWLFDSLGWLLGGLFVLGLALCARWVYVPRALLKNEDPDLALGLFVWLWFFSTLVYFGGVVNNWQDRFMVVALPPVFIAVGRAAAFLAAQVVRLVPPLAASARREQVALGLALVPVIIGAVGLFADSDAMVRRKLTSFESLRLAGTWLREHTPSDANAVCGNVAQLTYYSERDNDDFPKDLDGLKKLRAAGRAEYVVVSSSSRPPPWMQGVRGKVVMREPADKPVVQVFQLE